MFIVAEEVDEIGQVVMNCYYTNNLKLAKLDQVEPGKNSSQPDKHLLLYVIPDYVENRC